MHAPGRRVGVGSTGGAGNSSFVSNAISGLHLHIKDVCLRHFSS